MMKADDELKAGEKSILEAWFEAELVQILRTSDNDLEAALAALDRYLDQAPPPMFRKGLLTWKGRFYIEHKRYDDAVRVLRVADALQSRSDAANFITKADLAKALEEGGDPQEAYTVLIAALNEIEDPPCLLKLLCDLVRVTATTGQAMPPRAEVALSRAKQFYGFDDSPEGDLAAEAVLVEGLAHDASVLFDRLYFALKRAESTAEKIRLVEEYIDCVTVPYFIKVAEERLQRIREEAAHKS
jgi:tetratricopeptide (TPR) repeat protein